jgi:hypothetical protein
MKRAARVVEIGRRGDYEGLSRNGRGDATSRAVAGELGSLLTPRWREMDSNFRFREKGSVQKLRRLAPASKVFAFRQGCPGPAHQRRRSRAAAR